MSFAIELSISDGATPVLDGLIEALEDGKGLHSAIAAEAEVLTRDYILSIAPSRHKTAERLGATPTGYLERAAEGVTSRGEEDQAVLILGGDVGGFARAFGDVTITPKKGKYLTIPNKAAAYGKRAGEIDDLEVLVYRKSGGGFTLALGREDDDGERDVFYWLVKEVNQKQDRSLLPSDDQYLAAAELGAIGYLDTLN